MDYSVLVFLLFWGLNVIDASVDAHLRSFDVSPDLSLRFKAGHSDLARTNGFSLVLTLK
jgi:peroxiredoxin family protein